MGCTFFRSKGSTAYNNTSYNSDDVDNTSVLILWSRFWRVKYRLLRKLNNLDGRYDTDEDDGDFKT